MNRVRLTVVTQLSTIFPHLQGNIPKRWAGHAKWQNIKSTKEAQDRQRSMNFQRIRQKILGAVKENNDLKLKSALEEAKKNLMPKETLQNILKAAQNKETIEPYWIFYTGPSEIILGFEIIAESQTHAVNMMNQYLKKINLKHERNVHDYCNKKGLIISEPLQGTQNYIDKAIEDGIEAGVAEVTEGDNNTIYFECDAEFLQGSSKKLASLGYNIQSASTEIEFFKYIKVSNDDKKRIEEALEKLQKNFHDIIRIVKNVEEEVNTA